MTSRLRIVGASARAAAFSAWRSGYEPVAADLFADADLRSIGHAERIDDYPEGLVRFARRSAGVPWVYTGGLENTPRLVDRMASTGQLYGNGADVLAQVRSPRRLADALARAGLPFPAIETDAGRVPVDGSWLRKAYRSSGGSGVEVWNGAGSADNRPTYFQERIEGTSMSAAFVAAGGRAVLLGTTRQKVGSRSGRARPFVYAGSVGPLPVDVRLADRFRHLGDVLSRRFSLVGLFGVDVVHSDGDLWTLEVNPRYTASVEVLERAAAFDAMALHVAACRTGTLPKEPAWNAGRYCGKAIVYARRDVVIPEALASRASRPRTVDSWPALADVPAAGTRIAAGSPMMTVLAAAADPAAVACRLRRQATAVHRFVTVDVPSTAGQQGSAGSRLDRPASRSL